MPAAAPERTDPRRRRRWWQFSLGTGLLMITLAAFAFNYLTEDLRPSWREQELKTSIEKRGGHVTTGTHGREWAQKYLSPERLQRIEIVELKGEQFTDKDLVQLAELEHLRELRLDNVGITLAAIDQLIAARPQVECFWALGETVYASYQEAYTQKHVYLANVLRAYDEALGWKLDIARLNPVQNAECQAHQQYLRHLAEIQKVLSTKGTTPVVQIETAMAACAQARAEMRLAVCQGRPADAIATGRAAEALAQQLPSLVLREFPSEDISFFTAMLAARLSQHVLIHLAQLNHDRDAERRVREASIAFYGDALLSIYRRHAKGQYGGDLHCLALAATMTSAEEAGLARFSGSESPEIWQRAKRRADLLTNTPRVSWYEFQLDMSEVVWESELVSEIYIAASQTHSDAAGLASARHGLTLSVEQSARKIYALFSVGAKGGEYESWAYLVCKFMRCQLKEHGEAAYRAKLSEIFALIEHGSPPSPNSQNQFISPPPDVESKDWESELTPEERGQ